MSCNMTDLENDNIEEGEVQSLKGFTSSSNILFQESFEDSNAFSFAQKELAEDYSFAVATYPVFEGENSGRFELNDYDPMVANGTRAEIMFPALAQKDNWYSCSVYIPSKDYRGDSNYDIISQWDQGNGTGYSTIMLKIKNDRFFMKSGLTIEESKEYDIAKVQKDAWNEFVFHIIHSSDNDGLIELWLNGEKVLNIEGGNMDKKYELPKWKIGIYKKAWNGNKTTNTDRRVLFFDNVRLGNQNASFEEMTLQKGHAGSLDPNPEEKGGDGNAKSPTFPDPFRSETELEQII